MFYVFKLQMLRLRREPVLVLSFLLITLFFVFTMVGTGNDATLTVRTFSNTLSKEAMEAKLEVLNEDSRFHFEYSTEAEVKAKIQANELSFALEVDQKNYRFLVGQDSQFQTAVNQHVENVYRTQLTIAQAEGEHPGIQITQRNIVTSNIRPFSGAISNSQNSSAHMIVGMTLYFSVFTILYNLMNVAVEKVSGTWNRLIASPLKKTQIYGGLLLQYFMLGVMQILICFVVFNLFFNYDFGTQYGSILIAILAFVFAIVSLGILIVSIVTSPQQLQAVIPIFATSFAMLGGAFWPLEIVTNSILLTLAKLTPIYYGIEALKGAILLNHTVSQILFPISILILMGVICMGIGLNIMEKSK